MKKITIAVLLAVLALGLFTGIASAQTTVSGNGLLHDYMVTALADALALPVDEVDARLTAGETMYDVALAEGIAVEDVPTFLLEVRTAALDAAVADGVITQAQADRMTLRGSGMMRGGASRGTGTGTGTGVCDGTGVGSRTGGSGMMHGGGRWSQVNP